MRIVRTTVVMFLAIGIATIAGAYDVLRDGLAADRPPGRLETAIARRLVWSAEGSADLSGGDRDRATSVVMDGTTFSPNELSVSVGDTVEWINKDPFPHNVASALGGFRSGDLEPDQAWRWQAAKAGAFPYLCTLHPGMKGTLIVNK